MRTFSLCVTVLCLVCSLSACAGNAPATAASVPTIPPKLSSTPGRSLADFQDSQFVGEDEAYSVTLVNRTGGTEAAPTGELLINKKNSHQWIKMDGTFTVILGGGTLVYDDGKDGYVLLSIGTYISRTAVVLSLKDQKQAVKDFCMNTPGAYGDHVFWNAHIIFNTCDTFSNRPWGAGEAPGITAINLETGMETVIAKSDLLRQFQIKQVEGNSLRYVETSVENEQDWQNPDKQKAQDKTYDLSSLTGNQ